MLGNTPLDCMCLCISCTVVEEEETALLRLKNRLRI
jgi:hypothetical protein